MTDLLLTHGFVALIAFLVGVGIGHMAVLRSLLIGVDSPHGRTPTMIEGKLYYVVPESEYVRLKQLEARETVRGT